MIYNSPSITAAASDIIALGKPDRLLVNHWHEAMDPAPALDVPIFLHEKDRGQTDLPIAGTLSDRAMIGDDLEVIPTPGHTPGTTMFLRQWRAPPAVPGWFDLGPRGEWKAVLLAEGDRETYVTSLSLVRDPDFDILVPWGSEDGRPYGHSVTRSEARRNVERIIDRLRAGQNS